MQRTAQAWLVLDLTGSPAALGTASALMFLPSLLFSSFTGVIADRLPKRRVMLATQALSMLQAVVLFVLVFTRTVELWHVYALTLALGLFSAVEMPARLAWVSEMVQKEHLQSAVGLNSMAFNMTRIIGPAIAGLIISFWGVDFCFALNALSYVISIGALFLIKPLAAAASTQKNRASVVRQVWEGLQYAARTPYLALLLVLLGLVSTVAFNFGVTLPLLARYGFGTDAAGYGAMNTAQGIGSVIAGAMIASRAEPTLRTIILAGFGSGLSMIALGFVPAYPLALVLMVVLGWVSISFITNINTSLQLKAADEYRGRVMGLYTQVFAGSVPIGAAINGGLAEVLGIRATMAIAGTIVLLAVAGAALFVQRHQDQFAPVAEAARARVGTP